MTKSLWSKGQARPIEPLLQEMLPHLLGSDGLTISGGEPFDQPLALARLIDRLRESADVHVFSYSGYRLERLKQSKEACELLARLDMLMDGPYVQDLPTEDAWRGSANQRLHALSERAKAQQAPEDWRQLQLQPLADGSVRLIGIPKAGDYDKLRLSLHQKGLRLRSEL